MKRNTLAVLLSIAMLLTMACGVVNTLTGGGSGTTTSLWSDVPPFEGATKANLDLPLAAKLAVQAAFQGKLEFIAFTTTKGTQDVVNFYTADRMKSSGWTTESAGCTSGSTSTDSNQGAFCFYGKKEDAKETGLVIVVAQDDKTKQTQIFYVRIDVTPTPTPKP
jgi:hypothetical protein